MEINWDEVKTVYVTTALSVPKVADKFGLKRKTVSERCRKDGWVAARTAFRAQVAAQAVGEAVEAEAARLAEIINATNAMAKVIETIATDPGQFQRHVVTDTVFDEEGNKSTDVAMPCENPDIRGDKIVIGWLVRGIATAAVGDLTFNLRGVAEDAEGNPIIWNSGDEKRPVYSSLTCTPSEEQETALSELDALIKYVGQKLPELMEDVRKVPIVGENGNWWLWDFNLGKYVDSGKTARGKDGGYIIPSVKDVGGGYINFSFTPSDPSMDVIIMDGLIKLPEGPRGDDGGYFTPSVTQADGADHFWLQFTPSKPGMLEGGDLLGFKVNLPAGGSGGPDIVVDESEILDMLIELDALPAVADADGAILTDEDGAILMM